MTRSVRLRHACDVCTHLLAGAVVVGFTAVLVSVGSAAVVAADEVPVLGEDPLSSGVIPATGPSVASSRLSQASSSEPVPGAAPEVTGTVGLPELEITAEFDKPIYRPDDTVTVSFHLKNVGPEAVAGLVVATDASRTQFTFNPSQWGVLGNGTMPALLPGETVDAVLSGEVNQADADSVTLSGVVFDEHVTVVSRFGFSAGLRQVFGHVAGVVFADTNFNGRFDSGEGLAGIDVLMDHATLPRQSVTSGANGEFRFPHVIVGGYAISSIPVGDRVFQVITIRVDESNDSDDLRLRGVSPLNKTLHVSMSFTKPSYTPNEQAHLSITLTNGGSRRLEAIVAACRTSNTALPVTSSGWGDLTGSGVAIGAEQTRTVEVAGNVPATAQDFGYVTADCDFGYRDVDSDSHALATTSALVPGVTTTVLGSLTAHGHPPTSVPNVEVSLVSPDACVAVRHTTTDSGGDFLFDNVPVGRGYGLFFALPPSIAIIPSDPLFDVVKDMGKRFVIVDSRGEPAPPLPVRPSRCDPPTSPPPAAQGRSAAGLASTGSNVVWTTVLAGLALLLGTGAIVATRRRAS